MIGLITKFLPSGWVLYLLGSLAILSAGAAAGWTLQGYRLGREVATVQHQLDEYRAQVLADTLASNQLVQQKMAEAQQRIRTQSQALEATRTQLLNRSQKLTEGLDHATESSPLSKPVLDYLDKLRQLQAVPMNP